MIRSERYKYIAFRDCDDLAFDMREDPEEQHNLLRSATGEVKQELEALRDAAMDGFDFDTVEETLKSERQDFMRRFPAQVKPRTANQVLLGDGRLVDADMPLEYPEVVSENPGEDFDDWAWSCVGLCYSFFNASTGFVCAALIACALTVASAMRRAKTPPITKTVGPMSMR